MRRFTLLLCSLFLFVCCLTTDSLAQEESAEERRRAAEEQWRDKRYWQPIRKASVCEQRPQSEGERFVRAMQDYWQREMRDLWRLDANLNRYYRGAQGRINVTDKDCGLIRDAAGNPLRIGRNTCFPWKLAEYNTLAKVAERLKLVPQFGAERGFGRPDSREGGWIYDEIVRDLLGGEVYPPDGKPLYLPEHTKGNAGFAVLYKRGNAIRWYGPNCCALMSYEEANKEGGIRSKRTGFAITIDAVGPRVLPPGVSMDDFRVLRVSYHDVDFNLDSGQGGVYALGRGKLEDYNMNITRYYLISPCGTIICFGWPGTCNREDS